MYSELCQTSQAEHFARKNLHLIVDWQALVPVAILFSQRLLTEKSHALY